MLPKCESFTGCCDLSTHSYTWSHMIQFEMIENHSLAESLNSSETGSQDSNGWSLLIVSDSPPANTRLQWFESLWHCLLQNHRWCCHCGRLKQAPMGKQCGVSAWVTLLHWLCCQSPKIPKSDGQGHSNEQFGNSALHILTAAEPWPPWYVQLGPFQVHVQWLLRGLPRQV